MYILLHTYKYAITVYVLLRCIVSSFCIFSTCFIDYWNDSEKYNVYRKVIDYTYV